MSQPFPTLQKRHAAFLASVEEATLQDLLDYLYVVSHALKAGEADYPGDSEWKAVEEYLAGIREDTDPVIQVASDIEVVESLITERGNQRLK